MTGTLVYDADCGFCTRSAELLQQRSDCAVRPWQSLDLAAVGLTQADVTYRGLLARGRPYAEARLPGDRCRDAVLPGRRLPRCSVVVIDLPARATAGRVGLRARRALPLPAARRQQRLPAARHGYLRADSGVGVRMLLSSKCIGSV